MYGCLSVTLRRVDSGVLGEVRHRIDGRRAVRLLGAVHRHIPNVRVHAALVIKFPNRARRSFRRLLRFIHARHFRHVNTFTCSRRRNACDTGGCRSSIPTRIGRHHLSRLVVLRRRVDTRMRTRGINGVLGIVVSHGRNSCCVKEARFYSPRISPRILVGTKRGHLHINYFCGIGVARDRRFSLCKRIMGWCKEWCFSVEVGGGRCVTRLTRRANCSRSSARGVIHGIVSTVVTRFRSNRTISVPGFNAFRMGGHLRHIIIGPAAGGHRLIPPGLMLNFHPITDIGRGLGGKNRSCRWS